MGTSVQDLINKINQGLYDRRFIIYTYDFGKLEILAKSERKINSKLRAGLELFYLSEIEFIQGKTYKILTDAVLIESFQNIRNQLDRLEIAFKISEILDRFLDLEQKDRKIWNLLSKTFNRLNNLKLLEIKNSLEIKNWQLEIIYYYFLWNFLAFLGYQPELYYCSICQNKLVPEKLYFSCADGGIVCNQCLEKINSPKVEAIDPETVKVLRFILREKWEVVKRLEIKEKNKENLKSISNYYVSELQSHF